MQNENTEPAFTDIILHFALNILHFPHSASLRLCVRQIRLMIKQKLAAAQDGPVRVFKHGAAIGRRGGVHDG
jgi:hypothetical protein